MKVMWQSSVFRRTALVLLAALLLGVLVVGQAVLPAQAQTTNLALNRPVTCSSTENASFPCANAVDGNTSTRWASAFSDPQWIYVDLGATYSISRVVLNWEAAYGRSYQIQVSTNASTWTSIYSTTTGNGATDDLAVSGSGRYVRMYGTARATQYGYSLFEFQVYGGGTPPPTTPPPTTPPPTTPPPSGNLAQGQPVTCSSVENAGTPCAAAVDGNTSTRWASAFSDPQWIYVDLGATYTINRVVLLWEAAYGRSYQIQVSTNASTWTNIYSTTTGNGATDDLAVSGSGRYVRMNGTVRATSYGYSLWEFQVYGGGTPPPTTPPPTTPPPTTPPPTTPPSGQAPYGGTPWPVPGTIQAENYDTGGEGVAYHDTTSGNSGSVYRSDGVDIQATTDTGGGNNVGWTAAGEWLEYTINVTTGGTYSLSARVAAPSAGGSIHAEIDGANVTGTMSIPATGGWQTWTTVTSGGFSLTAGQHVLRIAIDAAGFNFNWVSLQSGTPPTTPPPTTPPPGPVDFGPNVRIFDPSMSASSIQSVITSVYNAQQNNHFGDRRDALLFKPGTYNVDIGVGFYTEVLGLGATPDAVTITGNLHSDSYLGGNNSTQNFWRGATNFSVTPNNGTVKWAVSQAIWFRQMHVRGNIALHQNYGWASGGWMANTRIDNNVDFGSQQQWVSRNTQAGSWSSGSWNMVFVGVTNPPSGNWPSPPYTKIATTPIVREKPFLQIDAAGNYSVRVPSLKTNSSGYDWAGGSVPGTTIPIDQFYIAHAGDSAATINAQLAAGKNLIFTPGIYALNDTIRVTRANTIVLGMGLATLRPTTGLATMTVADVDGVIIAGVLFDAGINNSPVQLEVGTAGNTTSHASNPIVLHDVIFRVGGAAAGKTNVSLRINANDTIVDHTWVWRADHGSGVGWTSNTAANGVVVNGNNVTMYGLFVEHYQQYQTIWNGNGGRVYFYQSEDPYDPPNQASWTSGSGVNGWASYKVNDNVTSHQAWGLGIYSVFSNTGVNQTRAIEVPVNSNVRFQSMVIKDLAQGHITYVINNVLPNSSGQVNSYP